MLVTSIFSFSRNVFHPIKDWNHHFSNLEFVVCKGFEFGPVKKIVVWYRVECKDIPGKGSGCEIKARLSLSILFWLVKVIIIRFLLGLSSSTCYECRLEIFSSREHIVLRMSYCDRSLSGTRKSAHVSVHLWTTQFLKKSFPLKPAKRFQWNFTEMILRWCTCRILQIFPWQLREKNFKNLLVPNRKG